VESGSDAGERLAVAAHPISRRHLATVGVLALLAGFVTWVAVRPGDDAAAPAVEAPQPGAPQAVSAEALPSLAGKLGHPVYWLGPVAGATYEVTETANGGVYLRYLARGVAAGNSGVYRTVGTYPLADAFGAVKGLAAKPGATRFDLDGGGIAAIDPAHPSSVYVAYPGSSVEVEVYDPSPGAARRLVTAGRLVAVG
jgi:hypothetical protein